MKSKNQRYTRYKSEFFVVVVTGFKRLKITFQRNEIKANVTQENISITD